jgi:phenylacetate-coenzyme A ligase PaaK-like adenylate-forming protein
VRWNGDAVTPNRDSFQALDDRTLRQIQNERLHRYLTRVVAPHSPYYRQLFKTHRIDPRRIKTVADLAALPFTQKSDLLPTDADPRRFLQFIIQPDQEKLKREWRVIARALLHGRDAVKRELEREFRPIFLTATTGRSSAPLPFFFTDHDMQRLRTTGHRLIEVFGGTTDMRVVNMFPYAPHLAFWQVVFACFEFGMLDVPTGGGKVMGTDGNVKMIEKFEAAVILGMPSFVYHVLRTAREQGKRFSHVRKVILGGEKTPEGMRQKMLSILDEMGAKDVTIHGTYGFTESKMAWGECPVAFPHSSGYHLYPDLGVIEVVDPDTGAVKGEGEAGEIVWTPIDARGTVVLRYRTGDIVDGGVVWEPCPHCHRTLPRIVGKISRRSNMQDLKLDKIKGTLVDFNSLQHLLDGCTDIEEWQVELRKAHDDPLDLDEFILHVAPRNGAGSEKLKDALSSRIHDEIEISPNRIEIHTLEDMLKRVRMETELKEKRVVDNRPK